MSSSATSESPVALEDIRIAWARASPPVFQHKISYFPASRSQPFQEHGHGRHLASLGTSPRCRGLSLAGKPALPVHGQDACAMRLAAYRNFCAMMISRRSLRAIGVTFLR
jgi:hypothetical protein